MSLDHQQWMAWEGGIDLVALTSTELSQPNVIVHVARVVHTPIGSAPSGMIVYQPDPDAPPLAMGFIGTSERIGAYFGPHIFAGTPFEQAPVLEAAITVTVEHPQRVTSRVEVGGHTFQVTMHSLGAHELIHREPAEMTPFWQQGLEAVPGRVELRVDGQAIDLILPPAGISGGPPAVYSASGIYAR